MYRAVIVNDFELAKQMANEENFSYRLDGLYSALGSPKCRAIDGSHTGDKLTVKWHLNTV